MNPLRDELGKAAALRALRAKLGQLNKNVWTGSADIRLSALAMRDESVALGSRILEAESLLLLGRNFNSMLKPHEALRSMARAREIFLANNLGTHAAHCQVIAARALFDMCHDRDAIAFATRATKQCSLAHDHRVAASFISAMSHAHLGEMDTAIQTITEVTIPLMQSTESHVFKVQTFVAAAAIHLHLILAQQDTFLWRSVPVYRRKRTTVPEANKVREYIELAKSAIPVGCEWATLHVIELLLEGMVSRAAKAADDLQDLAESKSLSDPSVTCWSYYCASLIYLQDHRHDDAIRCLRCSLRVAAAWNLSRATNDGLLQAARVYECKGDKGRSLRAYKAYLSLKDRISHHSYEVWTESAHPPPLMSGGSCSIVPLRNIEPQIVRQAVSYIKGNLGKCIRIDDLCEFCGVGRRTLEVAFKSAREIGIAQFIKECRLDTAASLLRNTNTSVKEIAFSVGYGSAAAFGRDFLRRFGAQPAKWRRQGGAI